MSSLRSRYPALDAATLASQSMPRASAGLGADLFALGVAMSQAYAATPAGMSWKDPEAYAQACREGTAPQSINCPVFVRDCSSSGAYGA